MGWFSRKDKDAPAPTEPEGPTSALSGVDLDFDGRPLARPLTEREQQRISAALESLEAHGVDVDDLASISSAYDAACAAGDQGDARGSCEEFAIAIGEHLDRHSTLSWAVVTDAFGTDLGLAGARSDTVVVPHNLVSARWMRHETGWIPRVVSHLVRLNSRG